MILMVIYVKMLEITGWPVNVFSTLNWRVFREYTLDTMNAIIL